jgi:hypothetical protein
MTAVHSVEVTDRDQSRARLGLEETGSVDASNHGGSYYYMQKPVANRLSL